MARQPTTDSDRVVVTPGISWRTEHSISIWVYLTTTTTGQRLFSQTGCLELRFQDLTEDRMVISRTFSTTGGVWKFDYNAADHLNKWSHILIVYDDSSVANNPVVYLNGTSVTVTLVTTPVGTSSTGTTDLHLLHQDDNTDRWRGRAAEFAFWDVLLNADEAAALAKGMSPANIRGLDLRHYLPLWGASPEPDLGLDATSAAVTGTNVVGHPPTGRYTPHRIGYTAYTLAGTVSKTVNIPYEAVLELTTTVEIPIEAGQSTAAALASAPAFFPLPMYSVVLVARTPSETGFPIFTDIDELPWSRITYTETLNVPGTATITVNGRMLSTAVQAQLRDLSDASEIRIHRDNRTVWAGEVVGAVPTANTLTVQAADLMSYLRRMWILTDVTFTQEDQATIVRYLIHSWQRQTWGHYGIRTSGIEPVGVLRDRTYLQREHPNIYGKIHQLSQVENGFDLSIHPYTRVLQVHYPQRGEDLSESIIIDDRVIDLDRADMSVAAGQFGTMALGIGISDQATLLSEQENMAAMAKYGRAGLAATFDGVSNQATLDEHTVRLLSERSNPRYYPSPILRPILDLDPTKFAVGDTVGYDFTSVLGQQTGTYRIGSRTVTVDTRETYTLGFI